jgi:hypothetical protein
LRARLLPWETSAALEQEIVLDTTSMAQVPRMLDEVERIAVAEETVELADRIMTRFAEAPPVSGALEADLRDDALLDHEEAATLILGLQDRTTRDRVAEWMEGDEAGPALRLWRALARRCVGPYGEHAAAPLTLVGWVAWSAGDEIEAREALAMALGADSDYLFARLLHQACNEGLNPESIRGCLRAEREARLARARSGAGGRRATGTGVAEQAEAPTEQLPEASAERDYETSTQRGTDASSQREIDASIEREAQGSAPQAATGAGGDTPFPSPDTATRRRRRTRSGVRPGPTDTGARSAGAEPGARTRPAAGARPGAARTGGTRPRPSGKGGAQPRPSGRGSKREHGACSEGGWSGGDATEGKA